MLMNVTVQVWNASNIGRQVTALLNAGVMRQRVIIVASMVTLVHNVRNQRRHRLLFLRLMVEYLL